MSYETKDTSVGWRMNVGIKEYENDMIMIKMTCKAKDCQTSKMQNVKGFNIWHNCPCNIIQ